MADSPSHTRPPTDTDAGDEERTMIRYAVADTLAKNGFGNVHVLSHDAADRALTPARRRIVTTLAERDVSSLRELAGILDRDPGNLSRDLRVLVAENVIRYVEEGRSKRPELVHDTIVVEPVVADAAIDPLDRSDRS